MPWCDGTHGPAPTTDVIKVMRASHATHKQASVADQKTAENVHDGALHSTRSSQATPERRARACESCPCVSARHRKSTAAIATRGGEGPGRAPVARQCECARLKSTAPSTGPCSSRKGTWRVCAVKGVRRITKTRTLAERLLERTDFPTYNPLQDCCGGPS